jgi:hypothetical protein
MCRAEQLQLNDWGKFYPDANSSKFDKVYYLKRKLSYLIILLTHHLINSFNND